MEEIAWKCSVAFLLGAATHYVITRHLQSDESSSKSSSDVTAPVAAREEGEEFESDSSDDGDWEGMDESQSWQPHKMVLCVRTDLKMGKGMYVYTCDACIRVLLC